MADEPTIVADSVVAWIPEAPIGKTKKAKEPKAKKDAVTKKSKSSLNHPPYQEMIKDGIVSLKERTGSSQYAISKFIEEKHKELPGNFKKLLLVQLKKLVAAGKLTKVKSSYKLPAGTSTVPKPASSLKKKTDATKPKPKPKAAKIVAKSPAKTKAVAKSKSAGKSKAVAKSPAKKAKQVVGSKVVSKPAKAARTSSKTSPRKKALAVKKSPVKKLTVKPKTVKKATPKKGKKYSMSWC